ncbi:MAG: STAS domain-containing protein [Treponema sp.]|jgi:anti-sigma B factor antagonist|nr:STAS domain-containing protein [Treponema sp.]
MTIQSERTGQSSLVMFLSGRLDTATAPQLERKIKQWGGDISELTLDFSGLTYISSMGLRVLLQTQKTMNAEGRKLVIRNMNGSIREVFEMTGFINLMVQEEKFIILKKEEPGALRLCLLGAMDSGGVPGLARELSHIREAEEAKDEALSIILDAEKLTSLSAAACRQLKEALEDSAWDKRTIAIRGASGEIRAVLQAGDLGPLLEA